MIKMDTRTADAIAHHPGGGLPHHAGGPHAPAAQHTFDHLRNRIVSRVEELRARHPDYFA